MKATFTILFSTKLMFFNPLKEELGRRRVKINMMDTPITHGGSKKGTIVRDRRAD